MSTAKATFITRASGGGSSVWHVTVLRVASLLDRSACAREVIKERKGREEKIYYYRANFGRGCVLGDVGDVNVKLAKSAQRGDGEWQKLRSYCSRR